MIQETELPRWLPVVGVVALLLLVVLGIWVFTHKSSPTPVTETPTQSSSVAPVSDLTGGSDTPAKEQPFGKDAVTEMYIADETTGRVVDIPTPAVDVAGKAALGLFTGDFGGVKVIGTVDPPLQPAGNYEVSGINLETFTKKTVSFTVTIADTENPLELFAVPVTVVKQQDSWAWQVGT